MRVAWTTDPHLNFLDELDLDRFVQALQACDPAAVFLTGDISEAPRLPEHLLTLDALLDCPIYFVLGNHDFYGGSIAAVRAEAASLTRDVPHLCWLPSAGVITLAPGHALVGQDGWGDGRAGDPDGSTVRLNDWRQIADLLAINAVRDIPARITALRALGDESAQALDRDLALALRDHARVTVLTHVPPFTGACWHDGAVSSAEWLPWYTCVAVGEVLIRAAEAHPDRQLEVYCGHTHSPGRFAPRPNLIVHTGAAAYGAPTVVALDLTPGS